MKITRDVLSTVACIIFYLTILGLLWLSVYYLIFYPLARMAVLGNATDHLISIIIFVAIGIAVSIVLIIIFFILLIHARFTDIKEIEELTSKKEILSNINFYFSDFSTRSM